MALWHVHTDAGDHVRALDAIAKVPTTSIRSRPARYLSRSSQIDLKRYDDAFGTLKALQSEARSAEVLNAMGVVQLRRGATRKPVRRRISSVRRRKPIRPIPTTSSILAMRYWIDNDPPAAIYWLREAVRRDPADGDAHFVLGAALQQGGATAEAARERELAQRLSSSYGRRGAKRHGDLSHGAWSG